ncbi:MAG: OmpH family outer membrane protein [Planctomycetota bacterium]|nr:OmpH family outer membrane protein [Planctomycetota bacterium]
MKKIVSVIALACCIGLTAPVMGQAQTTAAPAAAAIPVKIGLVDMAEVFKKYNKFEDMRAALKAEMEIALAEAKKIAADAEKVKEELKLLKQGTPEYIKRESDLAQLSSDFEAKRKLANLNYQRKEADIFQSIYVDATAVVKLYAEHFKFTMVMRFNSAELDKADPTSVVNGLNKLVIYHRPQDDITEAVIDYLNRRYTPTTPATTGPQATRPTVPVRN